VKNEELILVKENIDFYNTAY